MADLGEEAYSSQMKVIATFLRLLEELSITNENERYPKQKRTTKPGYPLRSSFYISYTVESSHLATDSNVALGSSQGTNTSSCESTQPLDQI